MNRAAEVHASEARELRGNAQLFVRHLKRSFPWVNSSTKLHILMYDAPDFFGLFGSFGLYVEQSIEAWHGFSRRNPLNMRLRRRRGRAHILYAQWQRRGMQATPIFRLTRGRLRQKE